MHGMHGDLREEVDGASDAWKWRFIDEFFWGERSEEAILRDKRGSRAREKRLTEELKVVNVVAFVFRCV
jgi:hypothetical protein